MAYVINIANVVQNEDGTLQMNSFNEPAYVHYFATAEHSDPSKTKVKQILVELGLIYISPLFQVSLCDYSKSYHDVNIETL